MAGGIGREEIVAEARKWIGTPFRHQGRIRGRGVDCVGLPLCVMRDLGIADWTEDFRVYPRRPMTDRVLEICKERLIEIPLNEPELAAVDDGVAAAQTASELGRIVDVRLHHLHRRQHEQVLGALAPARPRDTAPAATPRR